MKPELIVPAGNMDKLKFALAFGADCVYAGVPIFSLRARENQFKIDSIKEAVEYTHKQGKKIFLTCNVFAHNQKIEAFERAIHEIAKIKPDALIMADLGLISIVREKYPELEIHVSTQANTVNWAQVKFYRDMGIKHVVLARELSIDEIREIHKKVPDVALEVFVHGAMCFAYSGRCMISNYLTGRDSNQGMCSQSCRWQYKVYKERSLNQNPSGTIQGKDYKELEGQYYVEEKERPGELMRVDEDENGTYLFNSRDLCAIAYLKELKEAGVMHFKIEGRSKTAYYAAMATKCYREAIDLMEAGKDIPAEELIAELATSANRGFTPGLLLGSLDGNNQRYDKNESYKTVDFVGIIHDYDEKKKLAEVKVKNRFRKGDECEFVMSNKTIKQKITGIYTLEGESVDTAHGGDKNVLIEMEEGPDEFTLIRRFN